MKLGRFPAVNELKFHSFFFLSIILKLVRNTLEEWNISHLRRIVLGTKNYHNILRAMGVEFKM